MTDQDIGPLMSVSNTSPQDAADNINLGKQLDVDPDYVEQSADVLKPKVEAERAPASATPNVADMVNQSKQHASVAKEDIPKLNADETYWGQVKKTFEGASLNRQISDLSYRRLLAKGAGQDLSTDDRMKLINLDQQLDTLNQSGDGGYNFWEMAVPQTLSMGTDFVKGLVDNYDKAAAAIGTTITAGATAGAAAGATVGSLEPGGGTVVGAAAGAMTGAIYGARFGIGPAIGLAGAADNYKQTTGQLYHELSRFKDPSGNGLPEDDIQAISRGAGAVTALIGLGTEAAIMKTMPFFSKLNAPKAFAKYITSVSSAPVRTMLMAIGKSSLAGAIGGGSQEAVKIVAEKTAQSFDGTQESIASGINAAVHDWDTLNRIGKSATMGAIQGGVTTAVTNAMTPSDGVIDVKGTRVEPTVGDKTNVAVPPLSEQGPLHDMGPVDPNRPTTPPDVVIRPTRVSDIVGDNPDLPAAFRGTRALQLQIALAQSSSMTKDTNLKNMVPDELTQLRRKNLEDVGIPHIWIDPEEARKYSENEEKGKAARNIIDSTGLAAINLNAPIAIESHKFLDAVDDKPDISGIAKLAPEEPSAKTTEEFVNRFKEKEEKRKSLLKSFPNNDSQVIEETADQKKPQVDIVDRRVEGHENAIDHQKDMINRENKILVDNANLPADAEIPIDENTKMTRQALEAQIQKRKDVIENSSKRVDALKESKGTARTQDADIFNEQDYLNQPTFTKEIEGVLSKNEVEKLNGAQKRARQGVVDAINDSAKHEMNQLSDVMKEIALNEERQIQAEAVQKNPDIQIVEDFLNNKSIGELSGEQQERVTKKQPAWAINPNSLSQADRNRFLTDPVLAKRKVFHKDGVNINAAADAMGVKNGNELLTVLSSVPDQAQAIEQAVELRRNALENKAEDATDLNRVAITKAYNDMTKNHLNEMKVMLGKDWPSMAGGIKRIALPLPHIDDLAINARNMVNATPVKQLNANQWKVGERKSQREAINAILKNQVERAFTQKQAAAQNAQLAKETHIAIGNVNRAIKFVAKMQTAAVQTELKEAGIGYVKAVKDILDLYNFDSSQNKQLQIDNYRKLAEKLMNQGQGDRRIEPNVLNWLTDKRSAKDLTVEQFTYLADKMKSVLQAARYKHELVQNHLYGKNKIVARDSSGRPLSAPVLDKDGKPMFHSDGTPKLQNVYHNIDTGVVPVSTRIIADTVENLMSKHPDYDKSRSIKPQGQIDPKERMGRYLEGANNLVNNLKFITLRLDKGVMGETMSQLFYQPIAGIGKHEGTGLGLSAANKLGAEVAKHKKDLIAKYDKAELASYPDAVRKALQKTGLSPYYRLGTQRVFVPEFAGSDTLNNGHLTKLDLMELLKHSGNSENREYRNNFGIPDDTMMKVLERELPKAAFDHVQSTWKIFESFTPRMIAHEKATTGIDIKLVQKQGFKAHGTDYEGGYYPATFEKEAAADIVRKQNESLYAAGLEGHNSPVPDRVHDGIVSSPFTKERTGAPYALSLSPFTEAMALERLVYDLTMRIPVADVTKLLHEDRVAESISSVITSQGYTKMVNDVAESTNSMFANQVALFADQHKLLQGFLHTVRGGAQVVQLGMRQSVILLQGHGMFEVLNKMGPTSGVKHLTTAALKFTNPLNFGHFTEMYKFAADLDPSIERYREGIDAQTVSGLQELMPKKRLFTNVPYHLAQTAREGMAHFVMSGVIGRMDVALKTISAHAVYNQVLAGEHPGWPAERLAGMTDSEKYALAKSIVAEVNVTSLPSGTKIDRAAIQKMPYVQELAWYWNQNRNLLNSRLQDTRNFKYSVKEGVKKMNQKDHAGASAAFADAGTKALWFATMSILGAAMIGWARDRSVLHKEGEDETQPLSYGEAAKRLPGHLAHEMTSLQGMGHIADTAFGSQIPALRDSIWGIEKYKKDGTADFQFPLAQTAADVGTAAKGVWPMIQNITDWAKFVDAWHALKENPKQFQALIGTTSIFVGGVPIKGAMNAYNYITDPNREGPVVSGTDLLYGAFMKAIQSLKENHSEEKSTVGMSDDERIQEISRRQQASQTQQMINQAEQIQAKLAPQPNGKALSDRDYKIIKYAESTANGDTSTPTKGSRARGLYQFIPSTWEKVMLAAPELKLSVEGRYGGAKDSADQQEKAMIWLTEYNAKRLKTAGLPVNINTLYLSHFLGGGKSKDVAGENKDISVLEMDPKTSIKKVKDLQAAIASNNDLAKGIRLGTYKTVGDFVNKYIPHALDRGRREVQAEESQQLTSNP